MKTYQNTALKRLRPEVLESIRSWRRDGLTVQAIDDALVEKFGVAISHSSIRTLTLDIPAPDHWAKQKELVRGAVRLGSTRAEAAEWHGVDRTTANKWCRDLPGARGKRK